MYLVRNNSEFIRSNFKYSFLSIKFRKSVETFSERKQDDNTQLMRNTLKATNLVNIISMLYGMLYKNASTPVKSYNQSASAMMMPGSAIVKKQPTSTLELTALSLKALNQMSVLDMQIVQVGSNTKCLF